MSESMIEDKLLLTVADAAHRLSISPSALRRLLKGGQIPSVNIGRAVRVRREDVIRFVADQVSLEGAGI